jgi:hypothetical protein
MDFAKKIYSYSTPFSSYVIPYPCDTNSDRIIGAEKVIRNRNATGGHGHTEHRAYNDDGGSYSGTEFRWQWRQVWLHKKPKLVCRVSVYLRTSSNLCLARVDLNLEILLLSLQN